MSNQAYPGNVPTRDPRYGNPPPVDQYGRPLAPPPQVDQYGRPLAPPPPVDQYGRPLPPPPQVDQYGRPIRPPQLDRYGRPLQSNSSAVIREPAITASANRNPPPPPPVNAPAPPPPQVTNDIKTVKIGNETGVLSDSTDVTPTWSIKAPYRVAYDKKLEVKVLVERDGVITENIIDRKAVGMEYINHEIEKDVGIALPIRGERVVPLKDIRNPDLKPLTKDTTEHKDVGSSITLGEVYSVQEVISKANCEVLANRDVEDDSPINTVVKYETVKVWSIHNTGATGDNWRKILSKGDIHDVHSGLIGLYSGVRTNVSIEFFKDINDALTDFINDFLSMGVGIQVDIDSFMDDFVDLTEHLVSTLDPDDLRTYVSGLDMAFSNFSKSLVSDEITDDDGLVIEPVFRTRKPGIAYMIPTTYSELALGLDPRGSVISKDKFPEIYKFLDETYSLYTEPFECDVSIITLDGTLLIANKGILFSDAYLLRVQK